MPARVTSPESAAWRSAPLVGSVHQHHCLEVDACIDVREHSELLKEYVPTAPGSDEHAHGRSSATRRMRLDANASCRYGDGVALVEPLYDEPETRKQMR